MKRPSYLLGLILIPAASKAQFFDFTSGFPNETYHVTAVSADGKTIVGYNEAATGRAFRYVQGGAVQFLEPTGSSQFVNYSRAFAISGNAAIAAGDSSGSPLQTKWNSAGTPSGFDSFFTGSTIMALNIDGTIAAAQIGSGAYRVVNGNYTAIPTSGLSYNPLFITGMSGDGNKIVALNQSTGFGPDKVALWRQGIGSVNLTGASGNARISRDGSTIVAGSLIFDSALTSSTLSGLANSIAMNADAVSSTGSMIGGSTRDGSSGLDLATIWDSQRNPILLKTYLLGKGINANAFDMNDVSAIEESVDGISISGTYRSGNKFRPFSVHVVPEPASVLVLSLGGLMLIRRRKSKLRP